MLSIIQDFIEKNIRCKISGRRGNKCSKIIKKLLNRGYR